jgi:4-amino-4-deoxy-L-arabinose transferase-like glycosyltransferase
MIRPLPTRVFLPVWLLVAAGLTAAALFCGRAAGERGLTLSAGPGAGPPAPARRVAAVDTRDLWPVAGPGPVGARWDAFWRIPAPGSFALEARSSDAVTVRLDGREVLSRRSDARSRGVATIVELGAGFHPLSVTYEAETPGDLRLVWSPAGESPRDFEPGSLFTTPPSPRQLAIGRMATILGGLAWVAGLVPVLVLLDRVRRVPSSRERLRAILRVALPALVVLYAAALRFEALVGRYSWQGPPWTLEAERAVRALHPASLRWQPAREGYSGDPYNYLVRAREMDGFYEPNVREPLFPFVTRQLLRLMGDRNLAVNAASAIFSTLAVLATYLLGAYVFSPAVGLGAALGMAMHRDVLWFGVEGFRDDAFTLFAVASALGLLRLRERPTLARSVLAGAAAGGALLSRVPALSFLVPAFAWLALGRGPDAAPRRRAIVACIAMMLAVAGPYLLSCALAYGDPLYAVNFHTRFYRARSGMPADSAMGWMQFLHGFRPFRLLDTGLTGLTAYPFANKWAGFDYLSPVVGRVLSVASVAGLLLFLGSPAGRFLLIVLVTSLLPYAFTWEVPGGAEWRFTMVALPFYLIAAWLALARAARLLDPSARRDLRARLRVRGRAGAVAGAAAAGLVVAAWAGLSALTYLRVRESLRAGEPAMIAAGARDWFFFGPGWSRPERRGLVTVRRAEHAPAVVWLPFSVAGDQRLTLRADPGPSAARSNLDVSLNGSPVARIALEWDDKRIGSYELRLPGERLRPGRNRLELAPAGFVLWYLRIVPAAPDLSAAGSAR